MNLSFINIGVEADNNRERKMIGRDIIDRVRNYMYQKEKTIDERYIIRYVLHTEIIFSVWVKDIWGIKQKSGICTKSPTMEQMLR